LKYEGNPSSPTGDDRSEVDDPSLWMGESLASADSMLVLEINEFETECVLFFGRKMEEIVVLAVRKVVGFPDVGRAKESIVKVVSNQHMHKPSLRAPTTTAR
jgi:hypothetical protein